MYTRANPPQRVILNRAEFIPNDKDPFIYTPKGGFLEDAENYALGYQTSNSFTFWTTVHFISTMLKRDTWISWGAKKLFPNFYIFLLAPPARVKKSTVIDLLEPVYTGALSRISNPALAWRKKQELTIMSMATANAMFNILNEESNKINKQWEDENGEAITVNSDANLILRVSELTTLLSKAQYNATLIDKITDFFDCKDKDSSHTVSHGNLNIERIFCTLIGATTPSSFHSSMTEEAYGSGFMSRTIVVKEDSGYRIYSKPTIFPGVPDEEEMSKRLAFIGEHAVGDYSLTRDAAVYYDQWYHRLYERIYAEDPDETLHQDTRREIHMLKLAHVIAAQKYEPTDKITVEDVEAAIQITDYTFERAADDVMRAALTPENRLREKMKKIIIKAGRVGITKSRILQNHSKLFNSRTAAEALGELHEMQEIEVRFASGPRQGQVKVPIEFKNELYTWKGRR